MNVQMKMSYLQGGDDIFGPNLGEAKVYTAIPPRTPEEVPQRLQVPDEPADSRRTWKTRSWAPS